MNLPSLRKTLTTPDQTPELVATPAVEPLERAVDAPPMGSTEPPEERAGHRLRDTVPRWLRQNKVLTGLAIVFLLFWNLADWTSATGSRMRPGQYAYSNEMAQLWTASYRLVFIVGMAVLIIKFTAPVLIRYWRRDGVPTFDASRDFRYHLTPHQRLWFSFALLFALCYLFILLLGVRLPESANVGL